MAKPYGFSKIVGLSLDHYQHEVASRQRKSAKRTTQIKLARTVKTIKVAIDRLIRTKRKTTYQAIAEFAQVSLSTIKRYAGLIRKLIAKKRGLIRSIRVIASEGAARAIVSPLRGIDKGKSEWFISTA